MANSKIEEWKLIGHSYQIADTGDYDGHYEITNGKISIISKDDDEEALQPIVDALNNSGCNFYQEIPADLENHILRYDIEDLKRQIEQFKAQEQLSEEEAYALWRELTPQPSDTLYDKSTFEWHRRNGRLQTAKDFHNIAMAFSPNKAAQEQKPSDDIKKEFEEKIMRLSEKDRDGDTWIETRNVFKIFITVLKKLQPELKQVPTDEEIEKMAAEKYPIEMKEFKDFETSNQSILAFNNSLRIAYRESFIKGFKSALQLTNITNK